MIIENEVRFKMFVDLSVRDAIIASNLDGLHLKNRNMKTPLDCPSELGVYQNIGASASVNQAFEFQSKAFRRDPAGECERGAGKELLTHIGNSF